MDAPERPTLFGVHTGFAEKASAPVHDAEDRVKAAVAFPTVGSTHDP
jgi:hypothetical protein